MELSFGMIFSIILIVIFLGFGSYAIIKWIGITNTANVGKFLNDFQNDVNSAWKSAQVSQEKEYPLPSEIDLVCIGNYSGASGTGNDAGLYNELKREYSEGENLIFYPIGSAGGLSSKKIEHLNIQKTIESANPLCIRSINGKIKITLKKDYSDDLVTIKE